MISFGSDNHSPIHPRILRAIGEANEGWSPAYGGDPLTEKVETLLRGAFGEDTRSFLVFNGTGANVVGLSALLLPHEAVLCPESAHLSCDECGALERFAGSRLITLPCPDGKLRPAQLEPWLEGGREPHHVQPRVLSISQATEVGTLYQPTEIRDLAELAHRHGLFLHVDGARLANAAASLGLSLREASFALGVDILSFGGTKNGMLAGEAVVVSDRSPALKAALSRVPFARKQAMQLASKMRYLSAQFCAYLEGDLWLANARHANAQARRLADGLRAARGAGIEYAVEANAVFTTLPDAWVERLRSQFFFHYWDRRRSLVRLMTSFSTQDAEVDAFVTAVRALAERS